MERENHLFHHHISDSLPTATSSVSFLPQLALRARTRTFLAVFVGKSEKELMMARSSPTLSKRLREPDL